MIGFPWLKSGTVFLEMGESSLKVLDGENGLELPLERQENGRLTAVCRDRLVKSLKAFLKKDRWRPSMPAVCAVSARGISLRRLAVPATEKDQLARLMRLQIEREFPLGPDELAWGYCPVAAGSLPRARAEGAREFLVVAVKKEVLQEYADLLAACGLSPVFTLAAMARAALAPRSLMPEAILDIGRTRSELLACDQGAPASLHLLPWGGDAVTGAIERRLGIPRAEAEELKQNGAADASGKSALSGQLQAAIEESMHALATSIRPHWTGHKLYLGGGGARLRDLGSRLSQILGNGTACEPLNAESGPGRSLAILGLKRSWEQGADSGLPLLELRAARHAESRAQPIPWKWAALAGLLLVALLSMRYMEALLLKPRLAAKVAEVQAYRDRLPKIDRDLSFLQDLKTNQPAYLDALFVMANAAPAGARMETISMSRRGDLSFRTTLKDSQQVAEFRAKLIESGLFAGVSVEEQTPTPDQQKVMVRIVGQWRATGERQPLAANAGAASSPRPAPLPAGQGAPAPTEPRSGKERSTSSEPRPPGPTTMADKPPPAAERAGAVEPQ